jgi:hypothetical protein
MIPIVNGYSISLAAEFMIIGKDVSLGSVVLWPFFDPAFIPEFKVLFYLAVNGSNCLTMFVKGWRKKLCGLGCMTVSTGSC